MIQHAIFPLASPPPAWAEQLLDVFRCHEDQIRSDHAGSRLSSEQVLTLLAPDLERLGFMIEKVKHDEQVQATTSAERGGRQNVHFDVYQPQWLCCLAIEDGHDWANIGSAMDLVEPLLVSNADALCLAVPLAEEQSGGETPRRASEYERTASLAEVVYGHSRVKLPKLLLLIGY